MAGNHENLFHEMRDRIMGGIPNKPFRKDTRVADSKDMEDLPSRILNHPVTWYGTDGKVQPKGKRNTVSLAAVIGWLDTSLNTLITGQAAILAAVKAGSQQQGVDPAKLEKIINDAVAKSVGTYELRRIGEKENTK